MTEITKRKVNWRKGGDLLRQMGALLLIGLACGQVFGLDVMWVFIGIILVGLLLSPDR